MLFWTSVNLYPFLFSNDDPDNVCPLRPVDTNLDSWETIYEEYVLRQSDPDDYFFETVTGFMVDHDKEKNLPTYISWFSNEVSRNKSTV